MSAAEVECDVVVLGLGPGGEHVAIKLGRAGLAVVGVEDRLVGGECPYYGCVPSKMMIAAAHVVADPFADGTPDDPAAVDWDATLAFRRHLWSHGLGVAEAMDTAQRGMGLDWAGAAELIRRTLDDPSVAGGCFTLAFDTTSRVLAVYGWCSRADSYWTTFGDHAFFMRRHTFEEVGGFPDWPFLEDVAMRRLLLARGRFVKRSEKAVTSARRFRAEGLVRRQAKNAFILALHAIGVPAERLVRFYR